MIVRALAGMVLAAAMAIGALYGAYEYLGLTPYPHSLGAPVEAAQDAPTGPANVEPGEPAATGTLIEPPYEQGGAAAWLAEALAGSDPFSFTAVNGQVADGETFDLAEAALRATEPRWIGEPDEGEAGPVLRYSEYRAACEPQPSYLACQIARIDFTVESTASESGGQARFDASTTQEPIYIFRFNMQAGDGDWTVVPGSVVYDSLGRPSP